MQRPDKWDEIARKIVGIEWELSPAILCPAIATALRDAEKAGMERAAVIAYDFGSERGPATDGEGTRILRAVYGPDVARAIRAAKETKP